jgi:hypothetical protein
MTSNSRRDRLTVILVLGIFLIGIPVSASTLASSTIRFSKHTGDNTFLLDHKPQTLGQWPTAITELRATQAE